MTVTEDFISIEEGQLDAAAPAYQCSGIIHASSQ